MALGSAKRINNMNREICTRIANDFGVKLSFFEDDPLHFRSIPGFEDLSVSAFMPGSVITGHQNAWEIILGMYKDPDLQLGAFLHEIGHVIVEYHKYSGPLSVKDAIASGDLVMHVKETERLNVEVAAWEEACGVALKYNIEWTDKLMRNAEAKIASYVWRHNLLFG